MNWEIWFTIIFIELNKKKSILSFAKISKVTIFQSENLNKTFFYGISCDINRMYGVLELLKWLNICLAWNLKGDPA